MSALQQGVQHTRTPKMSSVFDSPSLIAQVELNPSVTGCQPLSKHEADGESMAQLIPYTPAVGL